MILKILSLVALATSLASCTDVSVPGTADPCEPVNYKLSAAWAPAWSADGRQVAFESALDQEGNFSTGIYIHDLATGMETKVYDDPMFITDLSWSTKENMMLLELGYSLGVLDLNTGVVRPMNTLHRDMSGAVWTWEGDSIYYTRGYVAGYNPPDSIGLFVTSPNGGPGRRLVPTGGGLIYPAEAVDISPGGDWLTFAQPIVGPDDPPHPGTEVYCMRRDGTGLTKLTHLDGFAHSPKWIEDGKAIVFDYYARECSQIPNPVGHTWIVRPDGGAPMRYQVDLGDRRVQFGFPPAIDREGRRALQIRLNPESGLGALYLTDIRGRKPQLIHPLIVPPRPAAALQQRGGEQN